MTTSDTKTTPNLIAPCGGELVNLMCEPEELDDLKAQAVRLPSLQLSERAVCDLELLATGGFSPLERFMGQADYERVLGEMRLADGHLFPMPITLPVDDGEESVRLDHDVALRDSKNDLLAIMTVEEIYEWDRAEFCDRALGTRDMRHPLVVEAEKWGRLNVSGRLKVLQLPRHQDFKTLRLTPAQTRARLLALGHAEVVAFQTRNPLHRAHEELVKRATAEVDGALLLHPSVGLTKPGDVDYFTRVRTYETLIARYFSPERVLLAILPLAMRMAGPREALWHALVRRNYGASHFIVGRDHASPGVDSDGRPFYGPYDAQELVEQFSDELGVKMKAFSELAYLPDEDRYEEASRIAPHQRTLTLSGTQVREQYLNAARKLPEWFTRPEVAEILSEAYPPRHARGVCIWFTGLSGAGKSTTAEVLMTLLLEHGRQVTFLDGDVVRVHLSQGLGFSRADRDTNIRRIGFVAAEVVRHGGIAVCAAVSPYRAARNDVRNMMPPEHFVEVFVDTPLEVCEERDAKGMYAKARRGEIRNFTGIDDPYEAPQQAELTLDTVDRTPEENAQWILNHLFELGFVRRKESTATAAGTHRDATTKERR